jgi:DNA-binding NarL/FixJ family response regulator
MLRALRMDARLHDVPVVVFSESHEPSDVVLSYQIGANSFVSKPASLAEIVQLMQEMSERGWLSGRSAIRPYAAQSL